MKGKDHSYSPELSDEELLIRYTNTGDKRWLGYLLDRYSLLLYGLSLKYLNQPQAAEDAVYQVFLRLLSKTEFKEVRDFKSWILVVMRNHCLQILRQRKGNIETLVEDRLEALEVADPGQEMENAPQAPFPEPELMVEWMEGLPEAQRICLRLFYLENCSYIEIAERTGYDFGAVKSAIQNGKRNLKIRWQKSREEKS